MKKQFLLCVLMFLVLPLALQARIWRVNNLSDYNGTTLFGGNLGGTSGNPVFRLTSQAVSSGIVLAEDTIYVEASSIRYNEAVTVRKPLVIIGEGYFLEENPKTSKSLISTEISSFNFEIGSSGSQLIGVFVYGTSGIDVITSNISVKRCRILGEISLYPGITDVQIVGNYFEGYNSGTSGGIGIVNSSSVAQNVVVKNNIFKTLLDVTASTNIITFLECSNNVFDCPPRSGAPSLRFNAARFENNILRTPAASVLINGGNNEKLAYNFSASATGQFGSTNNNLVVDMNALFVDPANQSTDGRFRLKPGSAVGSDGTERGAFGGAALQHRYVLSGLASIPVIYELRTTGVAGPNGIEVTIKARTQQ
jgi:hypothetical protein